MNKTTQLTVHFDNAKASFGVKVLLIATIVMLTALFYFYRINFVFWGYPFIDFILAIIIKLILFSSIGLFLFCIIYSPFLLRYKGPAAILNENGIWVKNYNFISWKNIEIIAEYPIAGELKVIRILVKNTADLYKQANFGGKISILLAKPFNIPQITLSNLDTENEIILVFAHRYLKTQNQQGPK